MSQWEFSRKKTSLLLQLVPLSCLLPLILIRVAADQCITECPLTNFTGLELTLRPGVNLAICLNFPNYELASKEHVALFNLSGGFCSTSSSFPDPHSTSQAVVCKLFSLDNRKTNCKDIGVVVECRLLSSIPPHEDDPISSSGDVSLSKRRVNHANIVEELGLIIQLNSTNHLMTGYPVCNSFQNITWQNVGCNIEEYHDATSDSCSGVGNVLSQVGTSGSWFVVENTGINEVGNKAILLEKSTIFCGNFNVTSSGVGLPCEVQSGNRTFMRDNAIGIDLVLNDSVNYLAFKCSGDRNKVAAGEAMIIFERNLTNGSDIDIECQSLSASRPFYSRYTSVPVHWAHGETNLCDQVSDLNFDLCVKMCIDDAFSNGVLCDTLAQIILSHELSNRDLMVMLGIMRVLSNGSSVYTLEVAVDLLDSLMDSLQNNSTAFSLQSGMMLASVIDRLLDEQGNWRILQESQSEGDVEPASSTLLGSLEQFLDIAGKGIEAESFEYNGTHITSMMVQRVTMQDVTNSFFRIGLSQGDAALQNYVLIPEQLLCAKRTIYSSKVNCSSVVGAALVNSLPYYLDQAPSSQSSSLVNSPLLVLSVPDLVNTEFPIWDYPVELHFTPVLSNLTSVSNYSCVFWDFTERDWSTAGISTEVTANGTYICKTTHLTSFAVLVGLTTYGNTNETTTEEVTLTIVSYVGCSISLLCLMLSLLVFLSCGKQLNKGVLLYVHCNFCLSLCLALLLFIGGIESAVNIKILCTAIAAVLHYLFLCAFCWMLAEGIMLYILIVKVFGKMASRWYYSMLLGWGLPLPIVAVTIGIRYDHYGTDQFCWLSTESGTIWAFVGPMLLIVCVNSVFLVLTVCSLLRSRKYGGAERGVGTIQLVRSAVKSTFILLPLLGLTWVLGIFAVNENTTVFTWLFTVCNSLQGCLFFFLHVVRNKKVSTAIKKCVCCSPASKVHRLNSSKDILTNVTTAGSSYATNKIGLSFGQGIDGGSQSYSQTSEEGSSLELTSV